MGLMYVGSTFLSSFSETTMLQPSIPHAWLIPSENFQNLAAVKPNIARPIFFNTYFEEKSKSWLVYLTFSF
jgi:hypothetical protein